MVPYGFNIQSPLNVTFIKIDAKHITVLKAYIASPRP